MLEKGDLSDISCISVPAAAKLLGVSRGQGYLMAKTGQLPTILCGVRRRVVPLLALRRMVQGKDDGSGPQQK